MYCCLQILVVCSVSGEKGKIKHSCTVARYQRDTSCEFVNVFLMSMHGIDLVNIIRISEDLLN